MTDVLVREFDPARDLPALHRLMSDLQEVERAWDPDLPPGDDIAADYLAWIFDNCERFDGKVFVAERTGRVVGFATALATVMPNEPDEPPAPFAFMTELIVAADDRGKGAGAALLAWTEAHARSRGARRLRTKTLTGNATARAFYARHGFVDREIELEKRLDD